MSKRKRWARQAAYDLEFAESVREHLRSLTGRERASVLTAIGRQLRHQPLVETRHRKPLRPNDNGLVRILGIGRKHGNALTIGGKEIQL